MPLGFMGVKGVVSPLPAAAFESTGAVGAGASRPMGDSSFFRFAISACRNRWGRRRFAKSKLDQKKRRRQTGQERYWIKSTPTFGRGLCLKIASNLLDRLAQGEAGGEGAGG